MGLCAHSGIWGYPHTPEGGEVKEAPRKAILSLFFFETHPDNLIVQKRWIGFAKLFDPRYDTFRRPTKGLEWREEISWWKLWNQWQKVAKTPQSQKHSWPTFWRKGYEVCSLSQPILTSLPNLLDYMGRKLCYSLQQVNYHCITGSWTP